jgi:DNA-binding LytR/AlgR family response regulator
MRIAYCEDERAQAVFLKELLQEWEKEGNSSCAVTLYASAEEMLFENPESFPFDFIILDIELVKMNGIELAREIRKRDKKVVISFLSNSREYVFDGYEVQAVRYLMKPISKQQLFPLLELVKQNALDEKEYIIVHYAGEKLKLCLEDILYVEAFGHYVGIHTKQQSYEVKRNINEMEEELKKCFIATHRSYLVNLSHIEKITKTECMLRGGNVVPISRSSYKAVNEAFISYFKGGALV